MKYADVAENVRLLLDDLPSQDEFIYELLLAYGKPKASITRLKQGIYNHSKVDRIYRTKPVASDEERLEHLVKLYEEMTAKEKLV